MSMRKISPLCAIFYVLFVPCINAGQITNNPPASCTSINLYAPVWSDTDRASITGVYAEQLEKVGRTTILDHFGPTTKLDWFEKSENDGQSYINEWNMAGRNAMQNIGLSSLRETVVGLPRIEENESLMGDFLKGTVGNTTEQNINPLSTTANASRVSWGREQKNDGLSYGIRPLNNRPYVYESMTMRDTYGKVRWYEDMRLRYVPLKGMRIEEETVIPLTTSWQMDLGTGVNPFHLDGNGSGSSLSISLSKVFNVTQIFSGGMNVNENGHVSFAIVFFRQF